MMDLPKCHCFAEGFEKCQGQEYVDTVASEFMSLTTRAIRHYPVCEVAQPYFLATLAASVLMSGGVVACTDYNRLDVGLIQRKALELIPQIQGIVEARLARLEHRERGGQTQ